jgi:hypothetical protein
MFLRIPDSFAKEMEILLEMICSSHYTEAVDTGYAGVLYAAELQHLSVRRKTGKLRS